MIEGDFDFELNISAVRGSNEMERAQLLELLKVYMTSQTFQMQYPQVGVWIFKKILNTYDAVKNAEEAFKRDNMPPIDPMAMMGQMGGQGGMQGGGMGSMPPGFRPTGMPGFGGAMKGIKP